MTEGEVQTSASATAAAAEVREGASKMIQETTRSREQAASEGEAK